MGEIRFVGTGETRGYPYLVCKKKKLYHRLSAYAGANQLVKTRGLSPRTGVQIMA